MCGIVGYIGKGNALEVVLNGLERLEYRGYDSAGVALYGEGKVEIKKAPGKLIELKKILGDTAASKSPHLGIGHTRWATHGKPSERNAHPHRAGRVSLIHNGIIENFSELKAELLESGCEFASDTDSEIAAHMLNKLLDEGHPPLIAMEKLCERLRGSYSFVVIDEKNPSCMLVAKNSTPMVVGIGEGEILVASDVYALLNVTRNVVLLEDGDIAEICMDKFEVRNKGVRVVRAPQTVTWDSVTAQKGGFKHFMLKEIHEQSRVVGNTFAGRIDEDNELIDLREITNLTEKQIQNLNRIQIVACGTAWHAGLIAKFLFESLTRIPCDVDYASEFRYRSGPLDKNTLVMGISQSGETADTLAAVEIAKGHAPTLAICNVLGSSITRKVDDILFTHAGPEISVASTKAFTTQLTAAYMLAVYLGHKRGTIEKNVAQHCATALRALPSVIQETLALNDPMETISRKYSSARDYLFLGRGILYPVALEGALKLKEISYIHAEGYPSGEMKHGPIALIDENMPVVVLLQRSQELFGKTLSNMKEVEARGGKIIALTDIEDTSALDGAAADIVRLPFLSQYLSPILFTIPLQFLAYHTAVRRGTDVDLPRNLAKSVTVE